MTSVRPPSEGDPRRIDAVDGVVQGAELSAAAMAPSAARTWARRSSRPPGALLADAEAPAAAPAPAADRVVEHVEGVARPAGQLAVGVSQNDLRRERAGEAAARAAGRRRVRTTGRNRPPRVEGPPSVPGS